MRGKALTIFTILLTITLASTVYAVEAPRNFRASQNGPLAADEINFAWNSDFYIGNIKGYLIYDDGKEILDVGKKYTAKLTNVSVGTHKYTLKSYDENGIVSNNSNQVIIKVLEAPQIVRSSNADRKIRFEWTRPKGVNIKHFVVLRNGSFYQKVDRINSSFEDKLVAVNQPYEYSLVVVDTDGNYSLQSNKIAEKTAKYSKARGNIEASVDSSYDGTRIKVTWDGTSNQIYNVYRKTDNGSWNCVRENTKGLSYFDYDVELGHTYRYQIKAFDSNKNTIYETNEKEVKCKKSLSNKLTGVINKLGTKIPLFHLTGSITGSSNTFNLSKLSSKPTMQLKLTKIKPTINTYKQKIENYALGKTVKLSNIETKMLTGVNSIKNNLEQRIGQLTKKHFAGLGSNQLKMPSFQATKNSIKEKLSGFKTSILSKI